MVNQVDFVKDAEFGNTQSENSTEWEIGSDIDILLQVK